MNLSFAKMASGFRIAHRPDSRDRLTDAIKLEEITVLRNDWKFEYTAHALAKAAHDKMNLHQERFDWWQNKRGEVMGTIRAEGLEIDEKLVFSARNVSHKARDYDRGAEVMIRNDLKKDLHECHEKLRFHTGKLSDYSAWQQVLSANPENRLSLDVGDWQFFFGDELGDPRRENDLDF